MTTKISVFEVAQTLMFLKNVAYPTSPLEASFVFVLRRRVYVHNKQLSVPSSIDGHFSSVCAPSIYIFCTVRLRATTEPSFYLMQKAVL